MATSRFYPSPANVTYYIGDTLIDDIFRVDFQRSVKHQPIWGYDSRTYDFVAKGKEIVMGNIVINYRYPGYLRAAIEKFRNIGDRTYQTVAQNFEGSNGNIVDDPAFMHTITSASIEDKAKLLANALIPAQGKAIGPQYVNNEDFLRVGTLRNNTMTQILKDTMIKQYGSDPEEESEHKLASPLDSQDIQTFDLTIRYGFQGSQGGYVRKIQGCVLVGESETVSASAGVSDDMSSSAQPILEVYSFFARDIKVV